MSKEWGKFEAEYKKLAPKIKKYAFSEAPAYSKRMTLAKANADEGQSNLAESMVTARKNGVTGKGLSDFVKDASFKEALGLFDKSVSMLQTETRAFEAFCKEAGSVIPALEKLRAGIVNDLKSRKDSSASKKDIIELQEQLDTDIIDLKKTSGYYDTRVNKSILGYSANFQSIVAGILKQAPAEQVAQKEETELPQLFVDRNITKNTKQAAFVATTIDGLCKEALNAAENNLKAALPHLNKAAQLLKDLKGINDSYIDAVKKKQAAIDASKDKAKIEKMIALIGKSYVESERKVRGTTATIKKAAG